MNLRVLYFASLVDRTGVPSEIVDVEPTADAGVLWRRLCRRHPALGAMGYRPMVAFDMEYGGWDRKLEGVREVAFLPPVSGG